MDNEVIALVDDLVGGMEDCIANAKIRGDKYDVRYMGAMLGHLKRVEAALATPPAAALSTEGAAIAWTVFDSKGVRFTLYSRELAEAIAERGLLVLPMLGCYEWLDAKVDTWKPINRLPYTWERELGVQWRERTAAAPDEAMVRELLASGLDEYGHHNEAENVREGVDLDYYKPSLFSIRAALTAALAGEKA